RNKCLDSCVCSGFHESSFSTGSSAKTVSPVVVPRGKDEIIEAWMMSMWMCKHVWHCERVKITLNKAISDGKNDKILDPETISNLNTCESDTSAFSQSLTDYMSSFAALKSSLTSHISSISQIAANCPELTLHEIKLASLTSNLLTLSPVLSNPHFLSQFIARVEDGIKMSARNILSAVLNLLSADNKAGATSDAGKSSAVSSLRDKLIGKFVKSITVMSLHVSVCECLCLFPHALSADDIKSHLSQNSGTGRIKSSLPEAIRALLHTLEVVSALRNIIERDSPEKKRERARRMELRKRKNVFGDSDQHAFTLSKPHDSKSGEADGRRRLRVSVADYAAGDEQASEPDEGDNDVFGMLLRRVEMWGDEYSLAHSLRQLYGSMGSSSSQSKDAGSKAIASLVLPSLPPGVSSLMLSLSERVCDLRGMFETVRAVGGYERLDGSRFDGCGSNISQRKETPTTEGGKDLSKKPSIAYACDCHICSNIDKHSGKRSLMTYGQFKDSISLSKCSDNLALSSTFSKMASSVFQTEDGERKAKDDGGTVVYLNGLGYYSPPLSRGSSSYPSVPSLFLSLCMFDAEDNSVIINKKKMRESKLLSSLSGTADNKHSKALFPTISHLPSVSICPLLHCGEEIDSKTLTMLQEEINRRSVCSKCSGYDQDPSSRAAASSTSFHTSDHVPHLLSALSTGLSSLSSLVGCGISSSVRASVYGQIRDREEGHLHIILVKRMTREDKQMIPKSLFIKKPIPSISDTVQGQSSASSQGPSSPISHSGNGLSSTIGTSLTQSPGHSETPGEEFHVSSAGLYPLSDISIIRNWYVTHEIILRRQLDDKSMSVEKKKKSKKDDNDISLDNLSSLLPIVHRPFLPISDGTYVALMLVRRRNSSVGGSYECLSQGISSYSEQGELLHSASMPILPMKLVMKRGMSEKEKEWLNCIRICRAQGINPFEDRSKRVNSSELHHIVSKSANVAMYDDSSSISLLPTVPSPIPPPFSSLLLSSFSSLLSLLPTSLAGHVSLSSMCSAPISIEERGGINIVYVGACIDGWEEEEHEKKGRIDRIPGHSCSLFSIPSVSSPSFCFSPMYSMSMRAFALLFPTRSSQLFQITQQYRQRLWESDHEIRDILQKIREVTLGEKMESKKQLRESSGSSVSPIGKTSSSSSSSDVRSTSLFPSPSMAALFPSSILIPPLSSNMSSLILELSSLIATRRHLEAGVEQHNFFALFFHPLLRAFRWILDGSPDLTTFVPLPLLLTLPPLALSRIGRGIDALTGSVGPSLASGVVSVVAGGDLWAAPRTSESGHSSMKGSIAASIVAPLSSFLHSESRAVSLCHSVLNLEEEEDRIGEDGFPLVQKKRPLWRGSGNLSLIRGGNHEREIHTFIGHHQDGEKKEGEDQEQHDMDQESNYTVSSSWSLLESSLLHLGSLTSLAACSLLGDWRQRENASVSASNDSFLPWECVKYVKQGQSWHDHDKAYVQKDVDASKGVISSPSLEEHQSDSEKLSGNGLNLDLEMASMTSSLLFALDDPTCFLGGSYVRPMSSYTLVAPIVNTLDAEERNIGELNDEQEKRRSSGGRHSVRMSSIEMTGDESDIARPASVLSDLLLNHISLKDVIEVRTLSDLALCVAIPVEKSKKDPSKDMLAERDGEGRERGSVISSVPPTVNTSLPPPPLTHFSLCSSLLHLSLSSSLAHEETVPVFQAVREVVDRIVGVVVTLTSVVDEASWMCALGKAKSRVEAEGSRLEHFMNVLYQERMGEVENEVEEKVKQMERTRNASAGISETSVQEQDMKLAVQQAEDTVESKLKARLSAPLAESKEPSGPSLIVSPFSVPIRQLAVRFSSLSLMCSQVLECIDVARESESVCMCVQEMHKVVDRKEESVRKKDKAERHRMSSSLSTTDSTALTPIGAAMSSTISLQHRVSSTPQRDKERIQSIRRKGQFIATSSPSLPVRTPGFTSSLVMDERTPSRSGSVGTVRSSVTNASSVTPKRVQVRIGDISTPSPTYTRRSGQDGDKSEDETSSDDIHESGQVRSPAIMPPLLSLSDIRRAKKECSQYFNERHKHDMLLHRLRLKIARGEEVSEEEYRQVFGK
ncbi:hypothetical protein ADUPG1_009012, partial [Aduncisulcus paluster]